MRTKWTWMIGLVFGCFCLSAPVPAQDSGDYDEPEEPQVEAQPMDDEQEDPQGEAEAAKRIEERRAAQGRSGDRRTYDLDRLERAMKKDLELDREQTEVIEGLFEDRREEYLEEIANKKNQVRTSREQMRDLLEKIRQARQEGDQEAEQEVTRNIRAMHDSVRVVQISEDFIVQIEEQLYEEQIERFRRLAARGRPGADLEEAVRTRPGLLRRYVVRLNLDDDTREEIEELYREVREEMSSGDIDYQERADRAVEFHDAVMGLIGEEGQKQLLKHFGGDAKRSGRARPASEGHEGHDHDQDDGHDEEDDDDDGDEDDS